MYRSGFVQHHNKYHYSLYAFTKDQARKIPSSQVAIVLFPLLFSILSDTVLSLENPFIGESAMRPIIFTTFIVFFILCTSGCSRVPQPVTYDFSEQQKMQATHHWDVLANDVANQINKALLGHDYVSTPVLVRATCGTENSPCKPGETTQFNEGFRDLLITQLVHFGVPTSATEDKDAIIVNYKVQVVYHRDKRIASRPPGALTALTTAITVLRWATWDVQAVATAGYLDIANSATDDVGQYEIIITTSMISGNKYLFRSSDIYYINDADFWHYQDNSQTREIQISNH